jgi:hypothetical protein
MNLEELTDRFRYGFFTISLSFESTTGRSEGNFEFLNTQFQPVEFIFKCLGHLQLKIFPPILITPCIVNY